MPTTALTLLRTYHEEGLKAADVNLRTAALEHVPGLQAQAQLHAEILNALTAGA